MSLVLSYRVLVNNISFSPNCFQAIWWFSKYKWVIVEPFKFLSLVLSQFNLATIQSWERKSISWFVSALSLCSSFSCTVAAFTWQVEILCLLSYFRSQTLCDRRLALWHRSIFISLYLIGCCRCACLQYFNCLNSQETGIVFCQGDDWKGVRAHTQMTNRWSPREPILPCIVIWLLAFKPFAFCL